MGNRIVMKLIFFYALISLGLLLDGAYLFRIVIFCCFVHELGHILAYIICTQKLPKLEFSAGGVCLKKTQNLTKTKKLAVLFCGSIANFLFSAVLYFMALQNATYTAYIYSAVSLCIGLYNMLPVGALDGAQIIELILPSQYISNWNKMQRIVIIVFAIALPICSFVFSRSAMAVVGAFIAPVYLIVQNKGL